MFRVTRHGEASENNYEYIAERLIPGTLAPGSKKPVQPYQIQLQKGSMIFAFLD